MPIQYRIDHARRVVYATGHGTLTDANLFEYQKEVWSRSDVTGYDEFMDVRKVAHLELESTDRLRELASLAAGMDEGDEPSKFAIVAKKDLYFGLARMYETFRELDSRTTREVGVFRSIVEAREWIGLLGDPPED